MCLFTQATEAADGVWVSGSSGFCSPVLVTASETSASPGVTDTHFFYFQLGNMSDVPLCQNSLLMDDPFSSEGHDNPLGFDLCIECIDGAHFPSQAELACVEKHLGQLEELWAERCLIAQNEGTLSKTAPLPSRPPPSAKHIIHIAFPSSPGSSQYSVNQMLLFIAFLQRLLYPAPNESAASDSPLSARVANQLTASPTSYSAPTTPGSANSARSGTPPPPTRKAKVLLFSSDGYTESSILALCLLMSPKPAHYHPPHPTAEDLWGVTVDASHIQSNGSPSKIRPSLSRLSSSQGPVNGGSSSWNRGSMSLPEAYLELQNARARSFFVYPNDLEFLKKMEARFASASRDSSSRSLTSRDRDGKDSITRSVTIDRIDSSTSSSQGGGGGKGWKWATWAGARTGSLSIPNTSSIDETAPANSGNDSDVMPGSTPPSSPSSLLPILSTSTPGGSALMSSLGSSLPRKRARASTSPMPNVLSDHWAWFSDPRFDGSFPSRVLPFLYLGNL